MTQQERGKSSYATLVWRVVFGLSALISIVAFTILYMTAGHYDDVALISGWTAALAMCAAVVAFLILSNRR